MVKTLVSLVGVMLALASLPTPSSAQTIRGVVLDQTRLPLPGVRLQLVDGSTVVATVTTAANGTFVFDAAFPGDAILATLAGFEPVSVPRWKASRIVLQVAHTAEATTVVAPAITPSSPTTTLLGSSLAPATVARLPSSHMKALESLPLLPSVIRGPDGLMQLAGSRAYDTPLTVDGFNLTDPATGLSSVNLPFEAVRGVAVLRDPMAVSDGGLIGGFVSVDTRTGADRFEKSIQGFVPRPRLASPGFARIESIFPRAFTGGAGAGGRIRYVAAAEYDHEHIAVPGVTQFGSDILEESAIAFTRLDARFAKRHALTVEALVSTTGTRSSGLGPRRQMSATADVTGRNLFAGLTHRTSVGRSAVFTARLSAFAHDATVVPNGNGPSYLSPKGWRGNWFSTIDRSATRYGAAVAWEQIVHPRGGSHDVTIGGEVTPRALTGRVSEGSVVVTNAAGRKVRSIDSGATATLRATDRPIGLSLRDIWHVHEQLQIDAGTRLDQNRYGDRASSTRVGVRYAIDPSAITVVKAGYGGFVGTLPLSVLAFDGYPSRTDRAFDPASGRLVREIVMRPVIGSLQLPRAVAATISVERKIGPRLDALVALTDRRVSRIARLHVPGVSGPMTVDSTGLGRYRDAQVAVRRTWAREQQLFVSYVRSSLEGELNEFAAAFQSMDAPLLQQGGMSHLVTDAPNRVLAWGTFSLPRRIVASPMAEWRSGFRFSALDARYEYDGLANAQSFPNFFTLDMIVYKTFSVLHRSADLGFQLFNATNHHNPRDVNPVVDGALPGQFDNSVGPVLRGYMRLKW
jgi:hypothetical protein